MEVRFQAKPLDLYVCVGVTLLVSAAVSALAVQNPFAAVLVLLVPGYMVVAALFPDGNTIDWIERITMSIGLSIIISGLLGLALDSTAWGLTAPSIATAVSLFVLAIGPVAYLRRMHLPVEERLYLALAMSRSDWQEYSPFDKALTIGLALAVTVTAAALVYSVTAPPPSTAYTDFYLLGPEGTASDYPTHLNSSQEGGVILGIVNHEQRPVNYTVRVNLVGLKVIYNASLQQNSTQALNTTTLSWINTSLDNGANWTQSYTFRLFGSGLWELQFVLFRNGDLLSQYSELHIFIRVS